jgi:hypothetical protein
MRLLVLALVAFCSEAADPRFSDELWNDIRPIYAQTLKQPFLTGIADGTLPRSHFQFYLTQDAKYLRVFGEVLSVLAAKAPRVEWAILLNQHAINSVKEERTLHESILRSYGVPLARRVTRPWRAGELRLYQPPDGHRAPAALRLRTGRRAAVLLDLPGSGKRTEEERLQKPRLPAMDR